MTDTPLPCAGRWREFTSDTVYSPGAAERMCHGCPIQEACLIKALRKEGRDPYSARACVWGGTTPKQRHLIATKGTGHRDARHLQHLAFGVDFADDCARCIASGRVAA